MKKQKVKQNKNCHAEFISASHFYCNAEVGSASYVLQSEIPKRVRNDGSFYFHAEFDSASIPIFVRIPNKLRMMKVFKYVNNFLIVSKIKFWN